MDSLATRFSVDGLNFHVLAVGVLVARLGEFRFLGGEALDDVFRRGARGRRVLERTFLSVRGKNREARSQQGHTKKQTSRYGFHTPILANFGAGSGDRCLPRPRAGGRDKPIVRGRHRGYPPSNPSPLSEAGGKGAAVLPLTWMPSQKRGWFRKLAASNESRKLKPALKPVIVAVNVVILTVNLSSWP